MDKLQISQQGDCVIVPIRLQPRSSRNAIVGILDGALKICLTAPPVEDRANQALVDFLADVLKIAKRNISIISGRRSKNKKVGVEGLSLDDLLIRLFP